MKNSSIDKSFRTYLYCFTGQVRSLGDISGL